MCGRRESEAAAAQKEFRSPLGDHITLLRIMRVFEALPQKKRNAWCQRHFVSIKSLRHAERVQGQLQARFSSYVVILLHQILVVLVVVVPRISCRRLLSKHTTKGAGKIVLDGSVSPFV